MVPATRPWRCHTRQGSTEQANASTHLHAAHLKSRHHLQRTKEFPRHGWPRRLGPCQPSPEGSCSTRMPAPAGVYSGPRAHTEPGSRLACWLVLRVVTGGNKDSSSCPRSGGGRHETCRRQHHIRPGTRLHSRRCELRLCGSSKKRRPSITPAGTIQGSQPCTATDHQLTSASPKPRPRAHSVTQKKT